VEEDFAGETRILAPAAVVAVAVAVAARCSDFASDFPTVRHRRHTPLEISPFSMDFSF